MDIARPSESTSVTHPETRYILALGILLAALSTVPYLLGAWLSSPEVEFTGFVIGVEDGNSYLANMLQGYEGKWLYHLPYTSEAHRAGIFFLFYLLLGKLARLTGAPLITIFHAARFILAPVVLLAYYQLIAYFTANTTIRRTAAALLAFGGGLGWVWILLGGSAELGEMPVDLWVPDASLFLSVLTYPHLLLGQALLFWFVLFTLRFLDQAGQADAVWAGLTGLGAALVHPYKVPVIGVPLGIYALWRGRHSLAATWIALRRLLLVALPALTYAGYAWWFFQRDFAFTEWQRQNLLYSPSLSLYVLGLGIPLALAILAVTVRPPGLGHHPFPLIWFFVVPPLLYLPHSMQRRFLDGYQAPVALLAAGGLCAISHALCQVRWRKPLFVVLLTGTILTNVFLLSGAIVSATTLAPPVYQPAGVMSAIRWLQKIEGNHPVVLSSYASGNLLPAHAPVRSFVGHGAQTAHSEEKQKLVHRFFDVQADEAWRKELLDGYGIDYVFYGPYERALGAYNPDQTPFLHLVYENGTVQIYELPSHPPVESTGPGYDQASEGGQ